MTEKTLILEQNYWEKLFLKTNTKVEKTCKTLFFTIILADNEYGHGLSICSVYLG
jgi:hypothetical protein